MIEKIKKAVHYISANHQELVASVRAIGLEMPKGFSALYEGEHVRFKGWILPFQSEDEIEWFVENEGCVVGSHELRIKRPDVLLHYKIQTNLTEYQGFDFSVEIGSFDKVFLKVNSNDEKC